MKQVASLLPMPPHAKTHAAPKSENQGSERPLVEAILLLDRLPSDPALDRAIRHCFPCIDPLHHLQVELVRHDHAGLADERVQRGIGFSINGTAAGLRHTG